jgi:hypothetical protein
MRINNLISSFVQMFSSNEQPSSETASFNDHNVSIDNNNNFFTNQFDIAFRDKYNFNTSFGSVGIEPASVAKGKVPVTSKRPSTTTPSKPEAKKETDPYAPTLVKYKKTHGYRYNGTQSHRLDRYSKWDELIREGKLSESEKKVILAVTQNEGPMFDAIQSYDSEAITAGIMQKTVNGKDGQGELSTQVAEFSKTSPDKYKELFENKGWYVEMTNNNAKTAKLFYKDPDDPKAKGITGASLKAYLKDKEHATKAFKSLREALIDPDFEAKQVTDFKKRIWEKSDYFPEGYKNWITDFITSERGIAQLTDQSVNRPGHVLATMGSALNSFYKAHPEANKDPKKWSVEDHKKYEPEILKYYAEERHKTSMTHSKKRYEAINKAGLSDEPFSMKR